MNIELESILEPHFWLNLYLHLYVWFGYYVDLFWWCIHYRITLTLFRCGLISTSLSAPPVSAIIFVNHTTCSSVTMMLLLLKMSPSCAVASHDMKSSFHCADALAGRL